MESQQLVIDDAVEQLKAARADKQPGPCMQSRDGTGAAQVHEQIEPGGKQQQLRSMQQPVGQEPDGRGRAIEEVVPGENLVKQNLVHRRHQTDPEKKRDRKSTRLNSSHVKISYAVFCLKKKTQAT